MASINCWEFLGCGREVGGDKTDELGVCPAAIFTAADGFCGGTNGGRACAYITGTFCSGTVQGTYKDKEKHCAECEFYLLLKGEHGSQMSVQSFLGHVRPKTGTA